jgi:hypothetical protein
MNYKKEYDIKNIDIWYGEKTTVVTIYDIDKLRYCKTYKGIIDADKIILEEVPKYKEWMYE